MADEAQITNNIETGWGRIGNLLSEAGRKRGIELNNLKEGNWRKIEPKEFTLIRQSSGIN